MSSARLNLKKIHITSDEDDSDIKVVSLDDINIKKSKGLESYGPLIESYYFCEKLSMYFK